MYSLLMRLLNEIPWPVQASKLNHCQAVLVIHPIDLAVLPEILTDMEPPVVFLLLARTHTYTWLVLRGVKLYSSAGGVADVNET